MAHEETGIEINIIHAITVLWQNKKRLFVSGLIGIIVAIVYIVLAPKVYEVKTTFLVPSEAKKLGGLSLGYGALLGGAGSNAIENHIMSITESQKIQEMVAKPMAHYVKEAETLQDVIDTFNLAGSVFLYKDKRGLFWLRYQYTDPKITLEVVQRYMAALVALNSELEISEQREIIRVLDEARLPDRPVKPNKALSLVLAVFLSGIVTMIHIFYREWTHKKPKGKG